MHYNVSTISKKTMEEIKYNNMKVPWIYDYVPTKTEQKDLQGGVTRLTNDFIPTSAFPLSGQYIYYCQIKDNTEVATQGLGSCFPILMYKEGKGGAFIHMFIAGDDDDGTWWQSSLETIMKKLAISDMTVNLYSRLTEKQYADKTYGPGADTVPNKDQQENIRKVESWLTNKLQCKKVFATESNFSAKNFKLKLDNSKPVQAIWEN